MKTVDSPTDCRLTNSLLLSLRALRDEAIALHNVARLVPDDRVFVAAELLLNVQSFAGKLKSIREDLQR